MPSLSSAKPVTFIMTRDKATSQAFYHETLGLPFGQQDDFATVYDLGGAILRVTTIPDFVAGRHPALGWAVADIVAAVTALTAVGVQFTIYDGLGQDEHGIWTAPGGTGKVAWFPDPDGNLLSLTQA